MGTHVLMSEDNFWELVLFFPPQDPKAKLRFMRSYLLSYLAGSATNY